MAPEESSPLATGSEGAISSTMMTSLTESPVGKSSGGGLATLLSVATASCTHAGSPTRNDEESTGEGVVTMEALTVGEDRVRRRGGRGFRARWRYPVSRMPTAATVAVVVTRS